ncbi:hypothetical protein [Aurantibacter sp.]|uniref:hypothetical protein n=1 Tax=Aurantibacter sp. TaxID=2807103 RepID=UPI0035C83476
MGDFQKIDTWQGLFLLFIFLVLMYFLLNALKFALERFGAKNKTNKALRISLQKFKLLFVPIASVLLLLDFISINYVPHTLILILICVFCYPTIKNYVSGIVFKINPLTTLNATIKIGNQRGEIKKMLPLGLVVNTKNGEQFINYTKVEEKGFLIHSKENNLFRQTLYVESEFDSNYILDVLFDNPIINYKEPPIIKKQENSKVLKLQYTLEKGANNKDIVSYLKTLNITTNSNKITN